MGKVLVTDNLTGITSEVEVEDAPTPGETVAQPPTLEERVAALEASRLSEMLGA